MTTTKFAGDFAFGCAEEECSIFIHKVVKVTVKGITVSCPLHKRTDGTYFYDHPDSRGIFERVESKPR